jgi:hypothetical protein
VAPDGGDLAGRSLDTKERIRAQHFGARQNYSGRWKGDLTGGVETAQ